MAWTWNLFDAIRNNFKDGYQFGDIFKSWAGLYDDGSTAESGGSSNSLGDFFNGISGVNNANAFNAAEAAKNRDWQTSERLASQEYNSAEAEKARDFSEMMESTRYQRTMQDMLAAGVNPMAAFMSGSASGIAGAGNTATASASAGSGSPAGSSGNSASAVSGLIRALAGLVKAAK